MYLWFVTFWYDQVSYLAPFFNSGISNWHLLMKNYIAPVKSVYQLINYLYQEKQLYRQDTQTRSRSQNFFGMYWRCVYRESKLTIGSAVKLRNVWS